MFLGQRVAVPLAGEKYTLGILVSNSLVKLDNGTVEPIDTTNFIKVGNAATIDYLVPYDHLLLAPNWLKLLRSSIKCPVYGTQFLYGVWATCMSLSGYRLPTPKIVITDRMEPGHLGTYYSPKNATGSMYKGGLIEITKSRSFTYAGLVGTLVHECAHQADWFTNGSKPDKHDKQWEHILQKMGLAMGGLRLIKNVDDTDTRLFTLPEVQLSKHLIYYLIVTLKGTNQYATWSDDRKELEHIALKLDPDLPIEIFESKDSSPLEWIPPEEDLKKFVRLNPKLADRIKFHSRKIY